MVAALTGAFCRIASLTRSARSSELPVALLPASHPLAVRARRRTFRSPLHSPDQVHGIGHPPSQRVLSATSNPSPCSVASWRPNVQSFSGIVRFPGRSFRHRVFGVRAVPTMAEEGQVTSASTGAPLMAVAPGTTRVGWIGTGVMGAAMAGHILDAGDSLTVFNRTIAKASGLHARGAVVVGSPKLVAERSDVVFTIVGYPSDVRHVTLGEDGVLAGLRSGGIMVDMTTSEPSLAREIATAAEQRGVLSVDAPVSGGDKGAKAGTLSIMVGGRQDVFPVLSPLLTCLGTATYLGPPGSGQSCKFGNQVTIASTMVGMVEGMLYAHKAGLDVPTYLRAISGGAAGSKSLELYSGRILNRDFEPGFFVKHFVKDLGIALEESRKMGLSLPGLAVAQQLYVSLVAHGEGNLGTQALLLALERINNTSLPKSN